MKYLTELSFIDDTLDMFDDPQHTPLSDKLSEKSIEVWFNLYVDLGLCFGPY
jgi:hypothetical protein